ALPIQLTLSAPAAAAVLQHEATAAVRCIGVARIRAGHGIPRGTRLVVRAQSDSRRRTGARWSRPDVPAGEPRAVLQSVVRAPLLSRGSEIAVLARLKE